MATLLAWLSTFLTEFGYALVKGAVNGDLTAAPKVMVTAETDAKVTAEAEAQVEAYKAANP